MSLLTVSNLVVRYGGAVLAVDDVTFEVGDRGRVALLGANGAGKTTVLRAVSGLLRYHGGVVERGEITFDGRVTTRADCSRLVGLGVAQVLEGRRIFADLSVMDNLRTGGFAGRRRSDRQVRDHILHLFPLLRERLDQPAGLLSGGEQQMLAIGRALMARPRLLLLDEPSLGLAPMVVRRIGEVLAQINAEEGVAILLVDQSTSLALALTDHGHLLETGRIAHSGPTGALLTDERVRASYLGMSSGGSLVAAEVSGQA